MSENRYAYFQRKADERAARREAENPRDLAMAAPEPVPTRSFGFQSGAARVNEGREKNLAVAGAEIGAPTAWAAGEGAPQPIGVIRGMKQTFATDAGGPQLAEFATPTQARQAFNRARDVGQYVPPEGPKIEALGEQQRKTQAAENRRPDLAALADATKAAQDEKVAEGYVGALKNYLTNTYGKLDSATGRMVFKPGDESMARDALAAEEIARREAKQGRDGGRAAISHFQERQNVRAFLGSMKDQLPPGFDANAYLSAMAQNPEAWQELVKKGQTLRTTTQPSQRKPWYEYSAEQHVPDIGP